MKMTAQSSHDDGVCTCVSTPVHRTGTHRASIRPPNRSLFITGIARTGICSKKSATLSRPGSGRYAIRFSYSESMRRMFATRFRIIEIGLLILDRTTVNENNLLDVTLVSSKSQRKDF